MKKLLRIGLLCAALSAALCVGAMATASGFYDVPNGENLTIQIQVDDGTKTPASVEWKEDSTSSTIYEGSQYLQVTVPDAADGKQYLMLLTKTNGLPPTANDIVFIDQQEGSVARGSGFKVYFDASRAAASGSKASLTMRVIPGAGDPIQTTVGYANNARTADDKFELGDVNRSGEFDIADILFLLDCLANKKTMDAEQAVLGDVNRDGKVDIADVLRMLQKSANQIDNF